MEALARADVRDGDETFEVSWLGARTPTRVVSFLAGRGGDPSRHSPLLTALAALGCTVVAPHFPMMASPRVDEEILSTRARRATLALDALAPRGVPVVGMGHSLGAATQLALAGARPWLRKEAPLEVPVDPRIARLVLFAPATSFLLVPGALDAVRAPVTVWAGSEDALAPPESIERLAAALAGTRTDVRIAEGADHFSFMHVRPPQTPETLPDRDAFLAQLVDDVARIVLR